jgi:hypothetical protein
MSTLDAALYDPFVVADDPYPIYRRLRDEHPVYRNDARDLWVLSRFADVESALRDPSTFSSANGISLDAATAAMVPVLLTMDPPRHDELRRLVSRAFTPRRVADLEPRVRQLAVGLLDRLPEGSFDVMDFASAFPTMVIAELLGVPGDDHAKFRAWVEATITVDPDAIANDTSKAPSLAELFTYLQATIAERREGRRDDMISALLDAEVDGDRLGGGEILGFTLLLLAAGFETTKNLIGNGVELLALHPAVRRAIVDDDALVPAVVEEVLRYESPVCALSRTTTREVELRGRTMPAGARVVVLYGSANRDERTFAEPDRFDPARTDDRHLAFGQGIHYCLGAALARLEARVAFEELLSRVPEYGIGTSERLRSPYIRGFTTLVLEP